jgi:hypothetical protein
MGYNELKNWEAVFLDTNCIRTMLYLAKYNPNKQLGDLQQALGFSENELDVVINKMIAAQMLLVQDNKFTLKESALLALDNFIQLSELKGV